MEDKRFYLLVEGGKEKRYIYENKFKSFEEALEHSRKIKAVKIRIFDIDKRAATLWLP